MTFDIERAEGERMKSLGAENPVWLRYVRIRDWTLKLGKAMGAAPEEESGWATFVLVMEAFPGDPEPADRELEEQAKAYLRDWMARGKDELLDAHEAVLLLDELMEQERIPADEALDRMGNLKELPFSDEVMAALIAVVPQPDPDVSNLEGDVLGESQS